MNLDSFASRIEGERFSPSFPPSRRPSFLHDLVLACFGSIRENGVDFTCILSLAGGLLSHVVFAVPLPFFENLIN